MIRWHQTGENKVGVRVGPVGRTDGLAKVVFELSVTKVPQMSRLKKNWSGIFMNSRETM